MRMPFFSPGSCQLTFSEVSRISVKLRCPTGPGTVPQKGPPPHPTSLRARKRSLSARQRTLCPRLPGMVGDKTRTALCLERPAWLSGGGRNGGAGCRGCVLLTIFVGAHQLGGAARPIPGSGEAEHGGEVLGELLQARHKAHVDAVLKIGPSRHHGNLLFLLRLPGDQLGGRGQPFRQGREDIPREAEGSPMGWASYRAPCRVLSMSHLSLDPHGDPAREVFY